MLHIYLIHLSYQQKQYFYCFISFFSYFLIYGIPLHTNSIQLCMRYALNDFLSSFFVIERKRCILILIDRMRSNLEFVFSIVRWNTTVRRITLNNCILCGEFVIFNSFGICCGFCGNFKCFVFGVFIILFLNYWFFHNLRLPIIL